MNRRELKTRSLARSSEETEKMDVSEASSSCLNGTTSSTTADVNNIRTNESVILVSDDEDFAGFGVYSNGKQFNFFFNEFISKSIVCFS